ncbi:MAG: diguanylate cyclase [Armatimonadota bacterium]|nr:diguanylate cyclase [Armatimonadota bacterium]
MKTLIDITAIAIGSVFMLWAIARAWNMRHAVQRAGYCNLLRTLMVLMVFFFAGYLFSIWALLSEHADWLHSIVAFVFLFGSVFVLLTIWLAQSTSSKLKQYSQHLEQQVEERTRHLQAALREQELSKRYFAQLFQGMPVACFTYDREGVIRDWNAEAVRLYGFSQAEAIGKSIYELFCRPEDIEPTRRVIERVFAGEVFREIEWQDITKSGEVRWILCSTFPLSDTEGNVVGAISANIDITERKRQQQLIEEQRDELEAQNENLQQMTARLAEVNAQLERMAVTDGLTELPNHRVFRERLWREFLWALERDRPLSVLLLDVDHFKQFNDTYGHQAGDEVLRKVALTLRQRCEGTIFPARYGGEEFVALLPDMDAHTATQFAERLRQSIADAPCCYRQITVSIGVSTLDIHTLNPESLVEEADRALYISKRNGRNRVSHAQVEDIRITEIAPEEWESRVKQAIGDQGGYAAQQVLSQMIYDHLQAMRRARCAVQTGDPARCYREGECRFELWKAYASQCPAFSAERLQAVVAQHERFHSLIDRLNSEPSENTLQELLQSGEELVESLQEVLAVIPCAA